MKLPAALIAIVAPCAALLVSFAITALNTRWQVVSGMLCWALGALWHMAMIEATRHEPQKEREP